MIPSNAILIDDLKVGQIVYAHSLNGGNLKEEYVVEAIDTSKCTVKLDKFSEAWSSSNNSYWSDGNVFLSTIPMSNKKTGGEYVQFKNDNANNYFKVLNSETSRWDEIKKELRNNILYKNTKYSFVKSLSGDSFRITGPDTVTVGIDMVRVFKSEKDLDSFLGIGIEVVDPSIVKGYEDEYIKKCAIKVGDFVKLDLDRIKTFKDEDLEFLLDSSRRAYKDCFKVTEVEMFNRAIISKKGECTGKFYKYNYCTLNGLSTQIPSVLLEVMTKKEYDERISNAKYIKLGNVFKEKLEQQLNGNHRTISQLQSALAATLTELKTKCTSSQEDPLVIGKRIASGVIDNVEKLKKDKRIKLVGFTESDMDIVIYTENLQLKQVFSRNKDVSNKYPKLPINIGEYKIEYNVLSRGLVVNPYKTPDTILRRHPHVYSGGKVCFGNVSDDMCIAMANCDIIRIFNLLILILETFNADSSMGQPEEFSTQL